VEHCGLEKHPSADLLIVASCRSRGITCACFTGGTSGCPERGGDAEAGGALFKGSQQHQPQDWSYANRAVL